MCVFVCLQSQRVLIKRARNMRTRNVLTEKSDLPACMYVSWLYTYICVYLDYVRVYLGYVCMYMSLGYICMCVTVKRPCPNEEPTLLIGSENL